MQNLTYKEQLQMKQVKLIRLLGKYCHVDEIIGMENPLNYRNKSQTAFDFKNGKLITGIYQSSNQKIVEVKSCMLEDIQAEKIVETVKQRISKIDIDGVIDSYYITQFLEEKKNSMFKTN